MMAGRKRPQSRSLLWLMLVVVSACATPQVEKAPEPFYVTPVISYLRECPEYKCRVVGELYRGDAVELVARPGEEWWQVYSARSGLTGWLQSSLLSRMPPSMTGAHYLRENLTLRDCPSNNCPGRKLLSRGEEVQKINDNGKGWWRVSAEKGKSIGWVPAHLVSDRPESPATQSREKSYLFVAPPTMNLYALPLSDSPVVKVVNRNDQVEKLAESGTKWLKVRHPGSGSEGWTMTSYLKASPVVAEEYPPKKKKAKKKTTSKKSKEEAPPESPLKPEPM